MASKASIKKAIKAMESALIEHKNEKNVTITGLDDYGLDLDPNEIIFAEELIKTRNAKKAYLIAYEKTAPDSARVMGLQLSKKKKVAMYIKNRLDEFVERNKLSLDECLAELSCIAKSNLLDYYKMGSDGALSLDLKNITDEQSKAIKKIKETIRVDEDGREHITRELELYDKHDALVNYIKALGGFVLKVEQNINVSYTENLKIALEKAKEFDENEGAVIDI